VQVVDTKVKTIALDKLVTRLDKDVNNMSQNKFMLSFHADDHEIVVFPDGRAIIKDTIDKPQAKELYNKYVREMI